MVRGRLWRERVQRKGSGKCQEANRRRQLETATQPDVVPKPPFPPGSFGQTFHSHHCNVPFVNRPFESEIHGTVNFTHFCCVLLVTRCYRVLLSCYLRPK